RLNTMNPGLTERLFSTRAQDIASRAPAKFGDEVLPTGHSVEVAQEMLGNKFGGVKGTIDALRSVDGTTRNVASAPRGNSLFESLGDKARNVGSSKVVRMLQDPKTLDKLNKVPESQRLSILLSAIMGNKFQDQVIDDLGWNE